MIKFIKNIFKKRVSHPLETLDENANQYCPQWSVFDANTGEDVGATEGCGIIRAGRLIDITGTTDFK